MGDTAVFLYGAVGYNWSPDSMAAAGVGAAEPAGHVA